MQDMPFAGNDCQLSIFNCPFIILRLKKPPVKVDIFQQQGYNNRNCVKKEGPPWMPAAVAIYPVEVA